jgi:hypothetical protein
VSPKSRTIDQFVADELVRREEEWLAGDYRAMVMAFMLCADNGRPLPRWVADAVMEHLEAGYFGKKAAVGRGRKGNPAARERDNTFHATRWNAARTWYGMKDILRRHGHPATWEGAFAMASETLEKSPAHATAAEIKKSFNLVQKAIRDGRGLEYGIEPDPPQIRRI